MVFLIAESPEKLTSQDEGRICYSESDSDGTQFWRMKDELSSPWFVFW